MPDGSAAALHDSDGGQRRAAVAVEQTLVLEEGRGWKAFTEHLDPPLERFDPLAHLGLLLFPHGELLLVLLVEGLERAADLFELCRRLVLALDGQ